MAAARTVSKMDLKPFVDIDPDSEPSRQAYIKFVEGKSESEVRWWTKDTVAVVTGGNKGIGFEIVRQLAKAGITTILTARDEGRGTQALKALKDEGLDNVLYHPLDVINPDSAAKLATWLKEKFGGVDILIGNAGASGVKSGPEWAKFLLDTNYVGQKLVVSALLPLLKATPAGARIVLVSSESGQLTHLASEKLKEELNDVDNLTEEDLDGVAADYLEASKEGTEEEWSIAPSKSYVVSKVLMNAYTRVLAKSLSDRPDGKKVYVNAMTPGLTTTDMSEEVTVYQQGRSVEHGADTAIWLALLPSGGPNGGFLRDRADYPWW